MECYIIKERIYVKMQDVLKQIVKETVSPLLKRYSFKKKGNNFARTLPDLSWTLNVQSSRWNTSEEVEFTMNTGIFTDKLFGTYYQFEPPVFPSEVDSVLRLRISELKKTLYDQGDVWYKLTPSTDLEKLKKKIEQDIEEVVIPHFQQFQTIKDVIQGLENREEQGFYECPHFLTILYNAYGYKETANKRMKKVYSECELKEQKEFTKELAESLGLEVC